MAASLSAGFNIGSYRKPKVRFPEPTRVVATQADDR
jgi:hypothetical protein